MNKALRITILAAAGAMLTVLPASKAYAGDFLSSDYDLFDLDLSCEYYNDQYVNTYDGYYETYSEELTAEPDDVLIPSDDIYYEDPYDGDDWADLDIYPDEDDYRDDDFIDFDEPSNGSDDFAVDLGVVDVPGTSDPISDIGGGDDVAPPAEGAAPVRNDVTVTSDMSRALGTINSMRAKAGRGRLVFNAELNRVAVLRAAEAARKFSHTRPNGKNGLTILRENGIDFNCAGENIAMGFDSAEGAVSAWSNSFTHNRCMMGTDYSQAGLGCVTVDGCTYWVLLLTD